MQIRGKKVVVFSCVLGGGLLSLEHNGSDTILIAGPPGARRWNCLWSPGVRVSHTSVPGTVAFTCIDY